MAGGRPRPGDRSEGGADRGAAVASRSARPESWRPTDDAGEESTSCYWVPHRPCRNSATRSDHLAPAPAPALDQQSPLNHVRALEPFIAVGREYRDKVSPDPFPKAIRRCLYRLQRGVEPFVAVMPDERLRGHHSAPILARPLDDNATLPQESL